MKKCSSCKKTKQYIEFTKEKAKSDGHSAYCKECNRIKCKEKNQKYYIKKGRPPKQQVDPLEQHVKKYNITKEEYLTLVKNQNNLCAICKEPEKNRKLAIDHCHISGKVRGLLCTNCNLGIGNLQDRIDVLHSAINYLEHNK